MSNQLLAAAQAMECRHMFGMQANTKYLQDACLVSCQPLHKTMQNTLCCKPNATQKGWCQVALLSTAPDASMHCICSPTIQICRSDNRIGIPLQRWVASLVHVKSVQNTFHRLPFDTSALYFPNAQIGKMFLHAALQNQTSVLHFIQMQHASVQQRLQVLQSERGRR